MKRSHGLSVIVIAMNEEDRIRACLDSIVDLADEIVVLDGGSEDRTADLCREYTDLVFETDWPGDGVQKQRALERATQEWVLRIDADERVSPQLRAEIAEILDRGVIAEVAFEVRWATYCFGRYLTHGEEGAGHLAFFKRSGARYTPVFVHSELEVPPGRIGSLAGRLYHDSHRDFLHLLLKLNEYSWRSAVEKRARGKTSGLAAAVVNSGWRFLKAYLFRLGFLDGRRGFLMAVLYAQYAFNKYAAVWVENQEGALTAENLRARAAGEDASDSG